MDGLGVGPWMVYLHVGEKMGVCGLMDGCVWIKGWVWMDGCLWVNGRVLD